MGVGGECKASAHLGRYLLLPSFPRVEQQVHLQNLTPILFFLLYRVTPELQAQYAVP